MALLTNPNWLGAPRIGVSTIPQPSDPKYLEYLADDQQFLHALSASMGPNGIPRSTPDAYIAIKDAAAANVGNLSPEERAEIIQSARMMPAAGYHSDPTKAADAIVRDIERMSNNQGYTGPDAGTVVAATPTADGGSKPITRGALLDNENFGNLVNSVFTAAGGASYSNPSIASLGWGMPGGLFNGEQNPLFGIDLTKWSEAERIQFLSKVAEFGRDGTMMSGQEQGELRQMAMSFSRSGDNEPAAVTVNKGFGEPAVISKDDLMENGTFEKQLNSIMLIGAPQDGAEIKALRDAIATANYDELGYDERVALIQAFNAANSDNKVTSEEIAGITQMLEGFQKSSGSSAAPGAGKTLSNGLFVSKDDVASDKNFMSMVNTVLDRSGVTTPKSDQYNLYGLPSFSTNQSALPILRGLDTSKLTAEQRIEVLEMISQAGSDREVTRDEANAIASRVNEFSGRGPHPWFLMA
jgi:hypothetical protein